MSRNPGLRRPAGIALRRAESRSPGRYPRTAEVRRPPRVGRGLQRPPEAIPTNPSKPADLVQWWATKKPQRGANRLGRGRKPCRRSRRGPSCVPSHPEHHPRTDVQGAAMLCVSCHYKYPCVYYAAVARGTRIKIGTSRDIWMRMKNIQGRLLALELGAYNLEAIRHQQFAKYRVYGEPLFGSGGSEWYRRDPVLLSLIDAIVDRPCESCAIDEEELQALLESQEGA